MRPGTLTADPLLDPSCFFKRASVVAAPTSQTVHVQDVTSGTLPSQPEYGSPGVKPMKFPLTGRAGKPPAVKSAEEVRAVPVVAPVSIPTPGPLPEPEGYSAVYDTARRKALNFLTGFWGHTLDTLEANNLITQRPNDPRTMGVK